MRRGLWVASAVLTLAGGAARAEGVQDCKSSDFRAALRVKADFAFDCVEIARVTPPVDGGRWTIRALRNASTPEGYVQVYAGDFLATAEKAFIAREPYVSGIGLKYGNVSIVFMDPLGSEVRFESYVEGHGHLVGAAHANGFSFPQDCIVSVNMEAVTTSCGEFLAPPSGSRAASLRPELALPRESPEPRERRAVLVARGFGEFLRNAGRAGQCGNGSRGNCLHRLDRQEAADAAG